VEFELPALYKVLSGLQNATRIPRPHFLTSDDRGARA
jgi:hypothetical protein